MNRRAIALARGSVAIAVAACLLRAETPGPVIIQIRVVDGQGAVYAVGARATRGLTIQVTDETGKPVEGASVSFQLPADGPGGAFSTGNKTEIVTTKADGTAGVWGMQWNKTPGMFEIRATASKGQARTGIIILQYLSDRPAAGGEGTFTASHHGRAKWLLIGLLGAGAGAGLAMRGSGSKAAPAGPAQTPLQIGNPTITVGHP